MTVDKSAVESASKPENVKFYAGAMKAALGLLPPVFKLHTALALQWGARKYGPWNWRSTATEPVRATTYISAMQRHLDEYTAGVDRASDTGLPHLAHLAASCAILLDAEASGRLTDDRASLPAYTAALDGAAELIARWPPDHSFKNVVA